MLAQGRLAGGLRGKAGPGSGPQVLAGLETEGSVRTERCSPDSGSSPSRWASSDPTGLWSTFSIGTSAGWLFNS